MKNGRLNTVSLEIWMLVSKDLHWRPLSGDGFVDIEKVPAPSIVFLNISLTPLWPVWPGDQATQTGCAIRSVETTTILTPINRCILINKSRLQWEINRWLAEEIFPFSMLLTTSWMRISEAGCCVFSGCLDMNGKNGFNLFCSGKLDPRLRNFNSMKNC